MPTDFLSLKNAREALPNAGLASGSNLRDNKRNPIVTVEQSSRVAPNPGSVA